jgi:hypothetical protein
MDASQPSLRLWQFPAQSRHLQITSPERKTGYSMTMAKRQQSNQNSTPVIWKIRVRGQP